MTRGVDLVFESDLPSAAGMSSSSALMIAVLLALVRANGLDRTTAWLESIATTATTSRRTRPPSRTAERFAGWPARAASAPKAAARITPRSSAASRHAWRNTRSARRAASGRSRSRPGSSSRSASAAWPRARPVRRATTTTAPRATPRECSSCGERRPAGATSRSPPRCRPRPTPRRDCATCLRGDQELLDRFNQFVEESTELVPAAADAARARRPRGIRPHRRALAGARRAAAAQPGARDRGARPDAPASTARWAASAFGAGFGGSVWALVEQASAHTFLDRWQNAYRAACPSAAAALAVLPDETGAGSRAVE